MIATSPVPGCGVTASWVTAADGSSSATVPAASWTSVLVPASLTAATWAVYSPAIEPVKVHDVPDTGATVQRSLLSVAPPGLSIVTTYLRSTAPCQPPVPRAVQLTVTSALSGTVVTIRFVTLPVGLWRTSVAVPSVLSVLGPASLTAVTRTRYSPSALVVKEQVRPATGAAHPLLLRAAPAGAVMATAYSCVTPPFQFPELSVSESQATVTTGLAAVAVTVTVPTLPEGTATSGMLTGVLAADDSVAGSSPTALTATIADPLPEMAHDAAVASPQFAVTPSTVTTYSRLVLWRQFGTSQMTVAAPPLVLDARTFAGTPGTSGTSTDIGVESLRMVGALPTARTTTETLLSLCPVMSQVVADSPVQPATAAPSASTS